MMMSRAIRYLPIFRRSGVLDDTTVAICDSFLPPDSRSCRAAGRAPSRLDTSPPVARTINPALPAPVEPPRGSGTEPLGDILKRYLLQLIESVPSQRTADPKRMIDTNTRANSRRRSRALSRF